MSQMIVEQIRTLIRQGRLNPGDRLPPERALCKRFGVSRVTVREALPVLEAGGLVEVRVGARGGAFVTLPTNARLGEGLADLLHLSPLVVERATEEDLVALERLCEQQQAAWRTTATRRRCPPSSTCASRRRPTTRPSR